MDVYDVIKKASSNRNDINGKYLKSSLSSTSYGYVAVWKWRPNLEPCPDNNIEVAYSVLVRLSTDGR
jgi:hypothetical protein